MKTAVIYCHPWEGSYNHAILGSVLAGLKRGGHSVDLIDLYKEQFDPVMSPTDLSLYSKGKSADAKVAAYQNRLDQVDHLIFIFPIWWALMPALLKGFFDKVLLRGWAYDYKGIIPVGKLTHIKGATYLTTLASPGLFYKLFMGKPLAIAMANTLKFCGIKKYKWLDYGSILMVTKAKREKWLRAIENYFANKLK